MKKSTRQRNQTQDDEEDKHDSEGKQPKIRG